MVKDDSDWAGAIQRESDRLDIEEANPWVMSNLDASLWFDPATGLHARPDDPRWNDPRPEIDDNGEVIPHA